MFRYPVNMSMVKLRSKCVCAVVSYVNSQPSLSRKIISANIMHVLR